MLVVKDLLPKAFSHKLPNSSRLRQSSQIKDVLTNGKKIVKRYFVLYFQWKAEAPTQMTVITAKRLGGAVTRNRIRRRIRESYRVDQDQLTRNAFLVFIGRSACDQVQGSNIRASMNEALHEIETS